MVKGCAYAFEAAHRLSPDSLYRAFPMNHQVLAGQERCLPLLSALPLPTARRPSVESVDSTPGYYEQGIWALGAGFLLSPRHPSFKNSK